MMATALISNEELTALTDSVNRFIRQHIEDHWQHWEARKSIPKSHFSALGSAGFFGADFPAEIGGSGAGFAYSAEIIKAFCKAGYLVEGGMLIAQQLTVAHLLNSPLVSALLTDKYLPGVIDGSLIPALAITEPQGGSDLLATRCEARPEGDYFRISGSKTFISNAAIADFFIVATRTTPTASNRTGLTLFAVDAGTPGIEVGKPLEKAGMQAANTAELFFQDVRVHKDQMLGVIDQALALLKEGLPRERCYTGLCATALCARALTLTRDYVNGRQLFGKPLGRMQNTRFELARMVAEWQMLDRFISDLVVQMHNNRLRPHTAAIARLKGVQTAMEIADKCALLFGGYGYMKEYPITRLWTDIRGMAFWGGPNEAMLEIIGRNFLTDHSIE